jgi:hypothetical protein
MKKLDQSTIEKLGYYVYLLKDPSNNEVFYVGKGKARRIFSHEDEALVYGDKKIEKLERIRKIKNKGKEPERIVLRHGLSEKEALEIEAATIDLLASTQKLTNLVSGHYSDERGLMSIHDIELKYLAEDAVFDEPAMLININRSYSAVQGNPKALYEATRKHWPVDRSRASKIAVICAVYLGIIREVYIAQLWRESPTILPGRSYFTGDVATKQVRDKFIDKSVAKYWKKGSQFPIKYVGEKNKNA